MYGDTFYVPVGGGAGYGDVLERDPQAVLDDLAEGLVTPWTVENIYKVVYDPDSGRLDADATQALRREALARRLTEGKPFEEFQEYWSTQKPSDDILKWYVTYPSPNEGHRQGPVDAGNVGGEKMTNNDLTRQRVVHRVLQDKAAQFANREFLRFQGESFGYGDLDGASSRVAAGLETLGIGKGDRAAIIMGNRPEYLSLWFGISKLGAVEVPVNTAHRGDLLTYMLGQSGSRVVVVEDIFLDRLAPVLRHLPDLERVVVFGDGEIPPLDKPAMTYSEMVDNLGRYTPPEVFWDDPFAIIYTSGTTGPSKGSVMPHNYALFMGEICMSAAGYDHNDRLYNALPLFHGNAQFLSTMPALMSGAGMVLAPRFSASRFWEDVKKNQCTEFNYIGGILQILYKAEPGPDDADNPLRIMFGAGAPPDLYKPFEERFGVRLIEGYGMSEIGVPMLNTVKERKIGSCGKLRPDYEVKLVDDAGLPVPTGQPGECLLRTGKPHCLLLEYHDMPAQTVAAWRGFVVPHGRLSAPGRRRVLPFRGPKERRHQAARRKHLLLRGGKGCAHPRRGVGMRGGGG